jgi:hypothetical protein
VAELQSLQQTLIEVGSNLGLVDRPPGEAAYVLCLLSGQDWEPVLGDLEEQHRKISARFGRRRADLWYWIQVLRSIRPLLVKTLRGAILAWLGEIGRRMVR